MWGTGWLVNRTGLGQRGGSLLSCGASRSLLIYTLLYTILSSARLSKGSVLTEQKASETTVVVTPCWQVEEFVIAEECTQCTPFQTKTLEVCSNTGFVEKINCAESRKAEYKSCRSDTKEEHLFWKFEGAMVGITILFAILVVVRQRALDGLASEKVRKQIESI
ncbi:protein JTB [Latimeria chalumnae]|uniref:Protein JTB n=1 Tax=Latimeria chalumnae TaxID=7897 RepID=H3AIV8_LATCH|nr:PREDICTED: protein JTB [Latimeria chalumnae]XP_014351661.1 PREDICTED: protein JTB [Latimeria chalumnae]|eukprot:XP_006008656.1 PREDICTED: protein JTB [Latimeria chalumnae]